MKRERFAGITIHSCRTEHTPVNTHQCSECFVAAGGAGKCPRGCHHERDVRNQIFLQLCWGESTCLTGVTRSMGRRLTCSVWRLLAGVAGSRGGAAQAEHRRPHRRSHPGEPAARCGVHPEAPRAGQQRVRPLQGWTVPQCHAGGCVPHQGPFRKHDHTFLTTHCSELCCKTFRLNCNPVLISVHSCSQLHCWTPEEACEKLASVRPHVLVRSAQMEMLRRYHQQVCGESTWTGAQPSPSHGHQGHTSHLGFSSIAHYFHLQPLSF